MDQRKELEAKEQASQPLKKMIPQLLISVSLFSFLISYSSLYNSSFPSSLVYSSPKFHHYFSPNSFHILGHALNKNCLFLICNGLLVFLAKTSGLIQPPAGHTGIADTLQSALDKYVSEETDGGNTADEPKQVSIFIAESEEEGEGEAATGSPDVEKDNENNQADATSCWLFQDDGEKLYEHEGDEDDEEDEDEDEDEDEEKEEMSTEELNRKFEDFIRKMKEEIIINEARQKVAMLMN